MSPHWSAREKPMVQVRLDRGLMRLVDHYCVDKEWNRAEAMTRLLEIGLTEEGYDASWYERWRKSQSEDFVS